MMNKTLTLALVGIVLAGASGYAAEYMTWGNSPTIYREGNLGAVPNAGGYDIYMYDSGVASGYNPATAGINGVDSTAWSTPATKLSASAVFDTGVAGLFYKEFSTAGGNPPTGEGIVQGHYVFTLIWNPAETSYLYIGGVQQVGNLTEGAGDPPTPTWEYSFAGSAVNGSDWVTIPEPGTLALLGLGLATIAVRRRLRR